MSPQVEEEPLLIELAQCETRSCSIASDRSAPARESVDSIHGFEAQHESVSNFIINILRSISYPLYSQRAVDGVSPAFPIR